MASRPRRARAPGPCPASGRAPGVSSEALVAKVKERGFTIGGGYGKWKPSTFRIGHMGDVDLASLDRLLEALDEAAGEAAA